MQEHAGNTVSIPGLGRSPGGGNGNPSWDNPRDRGAWQVTVHRVAKSRIQPKRPSMQAHTNTREKLH